MRVRHDNAGLDCESRAPDDPFFHAARHHGLEELAQEIALAEAAVPVLRERRVIGPLPSSPSRQNQRYARLRWITVYN